jgi:DnaK suppressor protein
MTKRELQTAREALEKLRDDTIAAGDAKIEPNRTDTAAVGVPDEDAQALSEMLQTLASQRNRKNGELLAQIARALRKAAEKPETFGTCEECEEPIAKKRIELMPYVTLCADCQSARDPARNVARRKITDYR